MLPPTLCRRKSGGVGLGKSVGLSVDFDFALYDSWLGFRYLQGQ